MDRLSRIAHMEASHDKNRAALDALLEALEAYLALQEDREALGAYYESPLWLDDFDADRKGQLPRDLKRGILTEDAVYDLLTDDHRLRHLVKRWLTETERKTPMIHHMNLRPAPFRMIAAGKKTFELRLYDEKRREIAPGDTLIFTNTEDQATLSARVVALHVFPTFRELYEALPLIRCGYTKEDVHTAAPEDMELYYPREKQEKYAVLAIEIALLS